MYSPSTRLLTVLELLQSYKQMGGAELAQRLEVDVRSIRRYIVMLQDMGIPIEAERGPYGAYTLMRGYKLPPLMFTDSEGSRRDSRFIGHPGLWFSGQYRRRRGSIGENRTSAPR
jgi:predicted DNA-binding transcriptional regulator YafY